MQQQIINILQPECLREADVIALQAEAELSALELVTITLQRVVIQDLSKILGQSISLKLQSIQGKSRYWHGKIESYAYEIQDDKCSNIEIKLIPALSMLKGELKKRIFREAEFLKIISKLMGDIGIQAIDIRGLSQHPKVRETLTQFNESDYDFMCRLLAAEAIHFYCQHDKNGTSLVLIDETQYCQPGKNKSLNMASNHVLVHHEIMKVIDGVKTTKHEQTLACDDLSLTIGDRVMLNNQACLVKRCLYKVFLGAIQVPQLVHNFSDKDHSIEVRAIIGNFDKPKVLPLPATCLQTAKIQGQKEGKVELDNICRVAISLDWPLERQLNKCFARFISVSMGNDHGFGAAPRVGDKVLIAYLNDDIENPLVIGALPDTNNPGCFSHEQLSTQTGLAREQADGSSSHVLFCNEDKQIDIAAADNCQLSAKNTLKLTAEKAYQLLVANQTDENAGVKFSMSDGEVLLVADKSISLEAGMSQVTMSSDKITLKSDRIELN